MIGSVGGGGTVRHARHFGELCAAYPCLAKKSAEAEPNNSNNTVITDGNFQATTVAQELEVDASPPRRTATTLSSARMPLR